MKEYFLKNKDDFLNAEYVVFGAGRTGKRFYSKFKEKIKIKFFIDNNLELYNLRIDGKQIFNPREISYEKYNVIIATDTNTEEMRIQLEKMGFSYGENLFFHKKFSTLIEWVKEGKVYITNINIPITYKCTLNCKYCGSNIPYHKNPVHRSLQDIKNDIELFFMYVDEVGELDIMGGEPFLHPNLNEIIEFIMDNYSERIQNLQIMTNATCRPDIKVIETLKKYKLVVAISDYSNSVNVNDKVNSFINKMKENSIKYEKLNLNYWVDFGTDKIEKKNDEVNLSLFFEKCNSLCRVFIDKKFYYCAVEGFAIAAKLFKEEKKDLIDFSNIKCKEKIVDFELGYISDGYLSYCLYCNGYPNVNKKIVKAGEQN